MDFEWDDAKSGDCFLRRGFDYTYAVRAFLDPNRIVGRDRRWDYGEGPNTGCLERSKIACSF